jgi:hypothetical protein
MGTTDRAKTWRVTLPNNRKVVVGGTKAVITTAGALVIVGTSGQPSHAWRSWHEIIELSGERQEVER